MKLGTTLESHAPSPGQAEMPSLNRTLLDRKDAAAALLLAGCVVGLFWRVTFTSAMFYYRDVYSFTYPHLRFIHEACRHGYLPYWNPYINYGEEVLANPNFLFFYPDTLLAILLPVDFAYTMHYVLHFAVAAVGSYALGRRWGQSRIGAFFSASVFTFSGPVLSLGNFYNEVACAAWIPWVLFLTDHAVEGRSRRPWILLTLVLALQFLAGEPFTWLATFALALAYGLYRRGNGRRFLAAENRRVAGRFVLVGCGMITLCALQLLPSLALLRTGRRGASGILYHETTFWSFHPLCLLDVVLPGFFGSPVASVTPWTGVLNSGDPYLVSTFVGFMPLFFALAGWAKGCDRRRHFAAASSSMLLLLSFGKFSPMFALAYLLLPPLSLVRFPVKLLIPAMLLVSLLAGWGLDALLRTKKAGSGGLRRTTLTLGCLLAAVVIVWVLSLLAPGLIATSADRFFSSLSAGSPGSPETGEAARYLVDAIRLHFPGLAGFLLGGLVLSVALDRGRPWARHVVAAFALLGLAQLVIVNYSANPTVPKSLYTYHPPVLAYFDHSTGPYRFCSLMGRLGSSRFASPAQDSVALDSIPEAQGLEPVAQTAFRKRLLMERATMLTGEEGVHNTDLDGSVPPFVFGFWLWILDHVPGPARLGCLLGRTNVRYHISHTRQEGTTEHEVAEIATGSLRPTYLYENPCLSPRAYVAATARYSASADETVSLMSTPGFDAKNHVVLATDPGREPPTSAPQGVFEPAGQVAIVDRRPNTITLAGEMFQPGYVVLLDLFDPNWHATVDGREVPIFRANQMFRAVAVAAGRHEVHFYYRQAGLRAGAVVSLVTLVLMAILYARDSQRRHSE